MSPLEAIAYETGLRALGITDWRTKARLVRTDLCISYVRYRVALNRSLTDPACFRAYPRTVMALATAHDRRRHLHVVGHRKAGS